jgi:decaprenyl-phosphate phosphoribosyltransferase
MTDFNSIIKIARPTQYIKNFFIFLPIFFDLRINNIDLIFNCLIAFVAFSATASGIYVLNDYCDIKDDKKHPKKKFRPIASGKINKLNAKFISIIFIVIGFTLMFTLSLNALITLFAYTMLNIFYSLYLKHFAIIDIIIIALGFVIRVLIGSIVTGIELSMWIIIMTFLLALFLALAKRRSDVLIFTSTGKIMRKVVKGYTLQFLDISLAMISSIVIVAYIVFITQGVNQNGYSKHLYLTTFFVIIGFLRYFQAIFVFNKSDAPEMIVLKDYFFQLILISWVVTYYFIIY